MTDDTGITRTTRLALHNRSMGRCEWCGRADRHLEAHHRLYRSRGYGGLTSKHDASNLLMLCGFGNTLGCHGRAHGAAEGDLESAHRAGVTLQSGQDPATIPIRSILFGIPVWLLPNGDVVLDDPTGGRMIPGTERRPTGR